MGADHTPGLDHQQLLQFRRDYQRETLKEAAMHPSPFIQFKRWFEEAAAAKIVEPNAMVLSTATRDGDPSSRVVLMKEFELKGQSQGGVVFYTNYESAKGQELAENPRAAIVFNWLDLERSVRIKGAVEKVSAEESDEYFASRSREAQIGSSASRQSSMIPDRDYLERAARALDEKYAGQPLPRPDFWGGYRLEPNFFEFWQGGPGRLHDRIVYNRLPGNHWIMGRISP